MFLDSWEFGVETCMLAQVKGMVCIGLKSEII